jgi:hypothetical protein
MGKPATLHSVLERLDQIVMSADTLPGQRNPCNLSDPVSWPCGIDFNAQVSTRLFQHRLADELLSVAAYQKPSGCVAEGLTSVLQFVIRHFSRSGRWPFSAAWITERELSRMMLCDVFCLSRFEALKTFGILVYQLDGVADLGKPAVEVGDLTRELVTV